MIVSRHSHFLSSFLGIIVALAGASAFAQFDLNLNPLGQGGDEKPAITVKAWFVLDASGNAGTLYVEAKTEGDHYIYGVAQDPAVGPVPTAISISPSENFKVGKFRPLKPPKKVYSDAFEADILTQKGTITWATPIQFQDPNTAKELKIPGSLRAQPCTKEYCMPPRGFPFTATFSNVVPNGAARPEASSADKTSPSEQTPPPKGVATSEQKEPPRETTPRVETSNGSKDAAKPAVLDAKLDFQPRTLDSETDGGKSSDLPWIILIAFIGGLLLNLMPCVLPVIGLKVLSFVEQSGQSAHKAFMLNAWYSLGLLSVFWILASLAAFLGFGWGQLFTYSGFNIALAAIVFVMGLGFIGVWELPIPGFVGSGHMAELGDKEGALGAFLKGVITTVLATPCTAPFLGTALAFAVARPTLEIYLVFTAVGLGMALPYLIIGAFPQLLAFVPKPGMWMETFKQAMGFVLFGTVVYLLTILRWYYMVPTVGLLFGLWAACWWINRVPITADTGSRAKAWSQAVLFAAVVWVLMFPGTKTVLASLGKPFAFPGLAGVMQARYEGGSERWKPFTMKEFEKELADGNTVMVDFTADWCPLCKTLEAGVLYTEAVNKILDRNRVVTFTADWTHGDPEVTEMLQHLGAKQVPVIAVFPADEPNRPFVLRGGYTTGNIEEAIERARPSRRE